MRIVDCLERSAILLDIQTDSLQTTCSMLVEALASQSDFPKEKALSLIMQREALESTSLGNGVAVPHARMNDVERVLVAVARLKNPLTDNNNPAFPTEIVFLVIAPEASAADYLKVLARIAKLVKDKTTRKELLSVGSASEMLTIIEEFESNLGT